MYPVMVEDFLAIVARADKALLMVGKRVHLWWPLFPAVVMGTKINFELPSSFILAAFAIFRENGRKLFLAIIIASKCYTFC